MGKSRLCLLQSVTWAGHEPPLLYSGGGTPMVGRLEIVHRRELEGKGFPGTRRGRDSSREIEKSGLHRCVFRREEEWQG